MKHCGQLKAKNVVTCGMDKTVFDALRHSIESARNGSIFISEMEQGKDIFEFSLLKEYGFINQDGVLTDAAYEAMERYKVKNAVILAAGMSTRLAPLSFERPKALFRVKGEVLIERLIGQLKKAGIEDITIVVGYMMEQFFYLEDKFGVRIVENPEYAERNNHSSVYMVRDRLGQSYICSSDQYYEDNPFHLYEWNSFFSVVNLDVSFGEYAVKIGENDRILGSLEKPKGNCWCLLGPAFLDSKSAEQYVDLLESVYRLPETRSKLWELIAMENLETLTFYAHAMPCGSIIEFDYLTDLCVFDADFLSNVESSILDNICGVLGCDRSEIVNVSPLKDGLTNLSVLFEVRGNQYVYRHPGKGTEAFVNRKAEVWAQKTAFDLGLDKTLVHEDPDRGWKISRYISGCVEFDYSNADHVARALSLARILHSSEKKSPWSFDFHEESHRLIALLRQNHYHLPGGFDELTSLIDQLNECIKKDAVVPCLCHNDLYGPNFLVRDDLIYLIDWEYSAMGDYGCDLGNFIAQGSEYSIEQAIGVLPLYFNREPTNEEIRHCMACTAIVGFYWYVWAIYKEFQGNSVGKWMHTWYRSAKKFGAYAEKLYACC